MEAPGNQINQTPPNHGMPNAEPESPNQAPNDSAEKRKSLFRGPLAWMAQNHVAANLLFFMFLIAGLLMLPSLRRELMPSTETERIMVTASYPGSSPDEVEEGIVIAIEEAVRGINGVKTINSTASEGSGSVTIELVEGADMMRTKNEIQRAVDQITTFPNEMDKPNIREMTMKSSVLFVIVYGDTNKAALREVAEEVRDDLISQNGVTVVELQNVESPEIAVEISQEAVQKYGLKIADVASAISSSSIDLSAGSLKSENGTVMLRTELRKRYASEFESVVLKTSSDGRTVTLNDVAKITDTFAESDYSASYNGMPAVQMTVYSTGDETPIGVSDAVRKYLSEHEGTYPAGINVGIRSDRADSYRVRIDLLMSNAYLGLILVLVFIGLFLDIRIAFWSAMGMLTAFIGSVAVMVMFNVSFNMISLFGFILALGIVVDDSIVIGEAVYCHRQDGNKGIIASLLALREVAVPVVFSVLTSIIAFIPILFIPGMLGKMYRDLPVIVIIILCISIVESMLILPAHLSGMRNRTEGYIRIIQYIQVRIAAFFERIINKYVRRFITVCVNTRYIVVAVMIAILLGTVGYVLSGRMKYTMMPEVEGDQVTATIRMAEGSPVSRMKEVEKFFLAKTEEAIDEIGRDTVVGVYSQVSGGSSATVQVYLKPATERDYVSSAFANVWRQKVGEIAGVEALSYRFNQGPGAGGAGAQFRLSHRDSDVLDAAADEFAARLRTYNGVNDVDVNTAAGKAQLSYKLKPEARSLGITEADFARQLRAAVYGSEALRQQRGRNEVKVFVRYPKEMRTSEALVEDFLIRTPSGGQIPLSEAATMERGHAFKSISRINGKRVLNVSAEINGEVTTVEQLMAKLKDKDMAELQSSFPGLTVSLGGMQADSAETNSKMALYFLFSIFAMYGMLAISSRSYMQPVMVLLAIPFGFVGAILGHIWLGYGLSLISILGMIALSGVVVNASIVLTSVVNDFLKEGMTLYEAVIEGATRRFRPIFLSVMTTFLGVFPMILEKSKEARFLIPMAISLGVGVLFSAIITLIIVPCCYVILDDGKSLLKRIFGSSNEDDDNSIPEEAIMKRKQDMKRASLDKDNK